jgi:adenylosuccinate synthase
LRAQISDRAHVLFDFHQTVDGLQESARRAGEALGTTRRGIGPCYATKATRNGVRMGALKDWPKFEEQTRLLCSSLQQQYGFQHDVGAELQQLRLAREKILHMITDTAFAVNRAYDQGQYILAEGANAAMLDIDAGTYPFVTSSSTAAGGVCTGLGLPPARVHCTIGVVKAYTTRVGAGPFPTELKDSVGDMLVNVGKEFGTTTGRRRRTGWLDLAVVRYSHMLNAYDSINITKLDVLSQLPELQVCVAYKIGGRELAAGLMPASLEDLAQVEPVYETLPGWQSDISTCRSFGALPRNAQRYVQRIEELTGVPVSWIGVGAGRDDMALHRNHF